VKNILERRRDATQKTLDRFKGKALKFGKYDCARMASYHLRCLGRPVKVAKAGTYHSALGATRALKKLGYNNLAEVADAHFPRIPPAAALVGDLIELESDSPLGCITVVLGNGRTIGWIEGQDVAVVLQPTEYKAAWRVL
jgi:hypothetical protein